MDDEAFARRLQQQLLDEERLSRERQQHQQQQQQQQFYPLPTNQHPTDSYSNHSREAVPQRRSEPQEYTRALQQQGIDTRGGAALVGRPRNPIQQYQVQEEDPDHILAMRIQHMEAMGTYVSQTFRSSPPQTQPDQPIHPRTSPVENAPRSYNQLPNTSNPALYSGGRSKSASTQEEEDARLARLLAESGQSFRDLDLSATSTGRYGHVETRLPTPSLQEARPPPAIPTSSPMITPQYFEIPSPGSGYGDYTNSKPPLRPIPVYPEKQRDRATDVSRGYGQPIDTQLLAPRVPVQSTMRNEPYRPLPLNMLPNPAGPPGPPPAPGPPRQLPGKYGRNSPKNIRETVFLAGTPADAINEPPMMPGDAFLDVPVPAKKEKNKKKGLLGLFGRNGGKDVDSSPATSKSEKGRGLFGGKPKGQGGTRLHDSSEHHSSNDLRSASSSFEEEVLVKFKIPDPVPRPADTIGAPKGPLPYSLSVSKDAPELPEATVTRRPHMLPRSAVTCAVCMQPAQNPLNALDKKYHNECFRCITCHQRIDPTGAFAYLDNHGEKQPMHRMCYVEIFGIKCCVCKQSIPAGPDGKVSFVKHPFFDSEQMCPKHARNMTRRCTGCHRFEPENEPFADLNDVGRCVCMSCCRSVVVDSTDAQPLWGKVIEFFENKLNMPIWKDLKDVPILVVGYNALNDQMNVTHNVHGGATQITTRGLCLTEHESGRRFRMNKMKYDKDSRSFVANDAEERGFTFFQVPDANKTNPDASVTAILCLSGLPRDLSASILAHEATHAWIKLHPRFDYERPIPPQVEEGCAQLIALLFLNDGLDAPPPLENNDGRGPSDEKLRQYFKFSIETDEHEIYGTGYRRAALAYSKIGIEALMSHVVLYQSFPEV